MDLKIAIVLVQCVMVLTAPMTLMQQLQGISQTMSLQNMMQQDIPLNQMMQQQMPLQQMIRQQMGIQSMMQMQNQLQHMAMPHLPLQGTPQQQSLALQEQMFALQQFQAIRRLGLMPSPMNAQPILVLYPDNEANSQLSEINTNQLKFKNAETLGDEDSEVIEASQETESVPKMKAVLLMPNSRGIIGDLISQIPFLPLEINVPDTISWMYNGIASIIAGLGQNRPQTQADMETQNEVNVKSIWNRKQSKMPIVVIPLGG